MSKKPATKPAVPTNLTAPRAALTLQTDLRAGGLPPWIVPIVTQEK